MVACCGVAGVAGARWAGQRRGDGTTVCYPNEGSKRSPAKGVVVCCAVVSVGCAMAVRGGAVPTTWLPGVPVTGSRCRRTGRIPGGRCANRRLRVLRRLVGVKREAETLAWRGERGGWVELTAAAGAVGARQWRTRTAQAQARTRDEKGDWHSDGARLRGCEAARRRDCEAARSRGHRPSDSVSAAEGNNRKRLVLSS